MSNVATCRRTGDILLFRPTSIMGYIAALFTWSRYSHATLVSVEDGVTYCLEVREFSGGRKIELEKYLKEEPSVVEVWRVRYTSRHFGPLAVEKMQEFVGVKYGWLHVFAAVLLRFVRALCSKSSKVFP